MNRRHDKKQPLLKCDISIRSKILLPFFLILIVLGSGATLVSVLLITEALSHSADQRLLAYREVVFREIKKQETLLDTFAHLLQLDQFPADLEDASSRNPIHDQLFSSLREAGISLTLYPAEMRDEHPDESVRTLFTGIPKWEAPFSLYRKYRFDACPRRCRTELGDRIPPDRPSADSV